MFALTTTALIGLVTAGYAADQLSTATDTRHADMPVLTDASTADMTPGETMIYQDGMDAERMDSNSDGMISKGEFIAHHELMYGKMQKNKKGQVDANDIGTMGKDQQLPDVTDSSDQ